jgi:hypothetical protein
MGIGRANASQRQQLKMQKSGHGEEPVPTS